MDIKMPDLKAVLGKLSALRNYLNLVVPLIIAIVAGLMFVPTALLSAGLKQRVRTESLARAKSLDGLAATSLSRDDCKVEREYQKAYAEDANQIERMAKETSQRELLSYRIFPAPKDASALIFEEFGKRYRAGIEQMITQMRGHDAPTEAEIMERLQSVQGQGQSPLMDPRMTGRLPMGRGLGRPTAVGATGRQTAPGADYGMGNAVGDQIIDAVCQESALSCGLYVKPMDVAGYNFWMQYRYDAGSDQAVTDCWYWQLGYWVIQDVFDTIATCNAGSKNVLEAPVKRLMRVGFTRSTMGAEQSQYARGGAAMNLDGTQADTKPQYVLTSYTGLTPPCTGRTSKGDIHVVHFDVTVAVRAGQVMDFMKSLCSAKDHRFAGFDGQQPPKALKHNQITVLESTARAVDRSVTSTTGTGMYGYSMGMGASGREAGSSMGMGTTTSHQLCRYGQDAVVELDLICEYLFEKAGYETLIPEAVKKVLENPEAAANLTR